MATFDGTTRKLYVDGTEIGSDTRTGLAVTKTDNFCVGCVKPSAPLSCSLTHNLLCRSSNNGEYFTGQMRNIKVWNLVQPEGAPLAYIASGSAKITRCSASNNQGGYNCNSAYDGVLTSTGGWAYSAQIPAWAIFNLGWYLDFQHTVAGLDLLSGVQRGNHRLKKFKITLKSSDNFIEPSNMKVPNAAGASISGATIEMQNCQDLLQVTFDPVAKVTAVRIDVYSTDASNNNVVLTEITVLEGSLPRSLAP